MGGSGSSVHYGLYRNGNSVNEASENTVHFMADLLIKNGISINGANVLDLGSGTGFSAHLLAQKYKSQITCLNYSPRQNTENITKAKELGLTHLIDVVEGDFENLPKDWDNKYNIIWSEEAFCHSKNRKRLFEEIQRVLKNEGMLIFTDIMCGSTKYEEDSSINERNTVTNLIPPEEYFKLLNECGFTKINYVDLTQYLQKNYEQMSQNIHDNMDYLQANGLEESFLENYIQSLQNSKSDVAQKKVKWGCFLSNKKLKR